MSVESSGAANSHKTSAASNSQAGKVKPKAGDAAGTPGASGFLALLASFDPESGAGLSADAAGEPVEPVDVTVATDSAFNGLPNAALPPDQPSELALLLSLASGSPVPPATIPGKLSAGSDGTMLDVTGIAPRVKRATKTEQSEVLPTVTALQADVKGMNAGSGPERMLDLSVQMSPSVQSKSKVAELQAGVNLAESRAMNQTLAADATAGESVTMGVFLTGSMGENLGRPTEKSAFKSLVPSAVSGMDSSWGYQSLLEGRRVEAPPEAANLSPEMSVADTVNYWVTQGVQNAELTLDGFGGAPVEVSITLKGDEAHIDFRTDQPEVRSVLEGAVAHLKDLLANEGLSLSGVSVGTSGQDGPGADAQDRRNRTGVRQANIVSIEAPTMAPIRRANPSVGRALDIFV